MQAGIRDQLSAARAEMQAEVQTAVAEAKKAREQAGEQPGSSSGQGVSVPYEMRRSRRGMAPPLRAISSLVRTPIDSARGPLW